ncbi:hypothetical protein Y032_0407g907 [Ancylostoma ceylanicum]|uniref:Uncharacterized protein n=1 Tax=Ancylostoma ceylanicum TaxID=53326 RepID=A0A016X223_9BILA|nr:hypothetical protein Y032_0407g907 [Ancylostoma ceylanicum]
MRTPLRSMRSADVYGKTCTFLAEELSKFYAGIDWKTCQIQEYVLNKPNHVGKSAIPIITGRRETRLSDMSDKETCLDHLRQDLICFHDIVEETERALDWLLVPIVTILPGHCLRHYHSINAID